MQLQEKHGEQLATMTINVDFNKKMGGPSDELIAKVKSKLKDVGVTSQNLIASEHIDKVLETYNLGGLPAALIFDRGGKLRKKIDLGVNYAKDVAPEVEALIAAKSP